MIKITDVDKNENTLRSIRTPKSLLEKEKEIHDTIESHHKVIYKPNAAIKRRKQKKHKNSTHKTKEMESFEPVEETKAISSDCWIYFANNIFKLSH